MIQANCSIWSMDLDRQQVWAWSLGGASLECGSSPLHSPLFHLLSISAVQFASAAPVQLCIRLSLWPWIQPAQYMLLTQSKPVRRGR